MPTVINPALPLLLEVESGVGYNFHIEHWLPLKTDTGNSWIEEIRLVLRL